MLQKSSLDKDQYSQGKQATDVHHLCLEPPTATSTWLCSLMTKTSAKERKKMSKTKWVEWRKLTSCPDSLWWVEGEGWRRHTWTGCRGAPWTALLGGRAHIPLCMGYPLFRCLNPSCNSPPLSPITSYFFHMPSASPHCSASQCPLLGHAKALSAQWFLSGPSRQPLLPAAEGPGEVSR